MYYPATPVNGTNFTQILEKFSSLNEPRIGRKLSIQDSPLTDSTVAVNSILDIVPVSGPDFIYDYIARFPNRTRWGITFNTSFASTGAQNIQYQVWYNASATNNVTATTTDIFGRDVLAMTRGMDEAIIAYLNDPLSASINPSLSVNLRDWPVTAPEVLSDVIVQQLGPVFFFCSEMIIFINVLSQVMTEKEMKLRHGMELMGMKVGPWLFCFFAIAFAFAFLLYMHYKYGTHPVTTWHTARCVLAHAVPLINAPCDDQCLLGHLFRAHVWLPGL